MATLSLKTHEFIKELVAEGMPEGQAEIFARYQEAVFEESLVTKQDLEMLRLKIQKDLEMQKQEAEKNMAHLEYRLTLKMGTMTVIAIGIILGAMRLMLG